MKNVTSKERRMKYFTRINQIQTNYILKNENCHTRYVNVWHYFAHNLERDMVFMCLYKETMHKERERLLCEDLCV